MIKYYIGKEQGHPMSLTKAWISKGLRKYMEEDEFGVYKKQNVKIPLIYKLEYYKCKRYRESYYVEYMTIINRNKDIEETRISNINHVKVSEHFTRIEWSIIDINKARKYMMKNIPCRDFEKTCGIHIGCSTCPYYQFRVTVEWAFEKCEEMDMMDINQGGYLKSYKNSPSN